VQGAVASGENDQLSAHLPGQGLTSSEVDARVDGGLTNATRRVTSRTIGDIVRANVLTRFNAILGLLLVVILVVGPLQDALFGFVLLTNTAIGIVQEVRSKRTLDRLSVLAEQQVAVARNGRIETVPVDRIVVDDLIHVAAGDQIVADGAVVESRDLEIDEALLTGEADPRSVVAGEQLRSGTIAVAGDGWYRADRVGERAYANQLAAEARAFGLARSELRAGINRILAITAWAMLPIGGLLLFSQIRAHDDLEHALGSTVAGTMSMVPEGLVLLTSMALAVSVLRLGRLHVLVQDLGAVELLARVDVICFDKTGTLTDGSMVVERLEAVGPERPDQVTLAIGAIASSLPKNETLAMLASTWSAPAGWEPTMTAPFSSARKWSGVTFAGQKTWLIGAPEVLASDRPEWVQPMARAAELSRGGRRVIAVAMSSSSLIDGVTLPEGRLPAGLIVLAEQLRDDARDAIRFLRDEHVMAKVISGDNPLTVRALAADAGLTGEAVDARSLSAEPAAFADQVEATTVFGRALPEQKREMVTALQSRGHTVAMTGDGVNDVLAVKSADLGIAIGNGAPATRAVAQMLLVDGRFSALPQVMHEGRRVIANVERVANLFVSKTVYAALLSTGTGILGWPFPFLPRHLSLIGAMTIGIPGFFLALGPEAPRSRGGFVSRIARFAIPAGMLASIATFGAFAIARSRHGASLDEARTAATAALGIVGFGVLVALARPLTPRRAALVLGLIGAFVVSFAMPQTRSFFALDLPGSMVLAVAAAFGVAASLLLSLIVTRRDSAGRGEPLLSPGR
jgi:cation-transporting P-type ATPase E